MMNAINTPSTGSVLEILRKAAPDPMTVRAVQEKDRRGMGYIRIHDELHRLAQEGLVVRLPSGEWRAWEVVVVEEPDEPEQVDEEPPIRKNTARKPQRIRFAELIMAAVEDAWRAPSTGHLLEACGWPEGDSRAQFYQVMIQLEDDGELFVESEVYGVRHWSNESDRTWRGKKPKRARWV